MKIEKTIIEIHCDYDNKIIPEGKEIHIKNLDFCSTECIEKYIEENKTVPYPISDNDNYGNIQNIERSISDILEYGSNEMKCPKCNGEGIIRNKEEVTISTQGVLSSVICTHLPNKICNICNGEGKLIIPNKKV